jgi:integrating conjugative element protein (TIGR03761 family)
VSESIQFNLGALRSAMKLTLHTHHAARIWHGRQASEGKNGIVGLSGFVSMMTKMKRGAEQDDPYSDWWMIRIEEKLITCKAELTTIQENLDQLMADVPQVLSIGDNLNIQPVSLPLFVNAQLGFMAVYLLTQYDDLARRLLLAHHTALIGRRDML